MKTRNQKLTRADFLYILWNRYIRIVLVLLTVGWVIRFVYEALSENGNERLLMLVVAALLVLMSLPGLFEIIGRTLTSFLPDRLKTVLRVLTLVLTVPLLILAVSNVWRNQWLTLFMIPLILYHSVIDFPGVLSESVRQNLKKYQAFVFIPTVACLLYTLWLKDSYFGMALVIYYLMDAFAYLFKRPKKERSNP